MRHELVWLLAREVETTETSCAPRLQSVGSQLAEVQAVGVDVVDVAELAGVDHLLELPYSGMVLDQVPDQ